MIEEQSVIVELGEARTIPRHMHAGMEIFYLLKGSMELDHDGAIYGMQPEDIAVFNAGETHGAQGKSPNILLRIFIEVEYLGKESGNMRFRLSCNSCRDKSAAAAPLYAKLRRLLYRYMLARFESAAPKPLECKSILLHILAFLQENFLDARAENTQRQYDKRIESVLGYIQGAYRSDISLQAIAEREHLSLHYLSRLFKKNVGMGFTEYLHRLRLHSAVNDLLHTKESVLKIALNNGFSNVSSFNKLFQKEYHATPAKYRASRGLEKTAINAQTELHKAFDQNEDLVKYLRQFDAKSAQEIGRRRECDIDARASSREGLKLPGKVVRAGRIAELLKADIQQQLTALGQDMAVDYVHFRCLLEDGIYAYRGAVYARYEYYAALDFLLGAHLAPFLQFCMRERDCEAVCGDVARFLQSMIKRYPREFTTRWIFEIVLPETAAREAPLSQYARLCEVIRRYLPEARIGFAIEEGGNSEEAADILREMEARQCRPSFLTYYARGMEAPNVAEDIDYAEYRNHNAGKLARFVQDLQRNGQSYSIMLLRWNTLSGFTTVEANAFYRLALYLDEILHMPPEISAIACWLNTYVHEAALGEEGFDAIALYLFGQLKRPMYFAFCLLDKLYPEIVGRDDMLLATRDAQGNLAVLLWNPCYFAPGYAADKAFTDTWQLGFLLRFAGLSGACIFERFHVDNSHTAIYDRWAQMGFPPIMDRNVTQQLARMVHMDYSMLMEQMESGHALSVSLKFNEAMLVYCRKPEREGMGQNI